MLPRSRPSRQCFKQGKAVIDADIEFTVEGSREQHVAANYCGIRKDFYETLHA